MSVLNTNIGSQFTNISSDTATKSLWIAAILTFGVGDILTTIVGLHIGMTEINPFFQLFNTASLTVAIPVMIVSKTFIMTVLWGVGTTLPRINLWGFNYFPYIVPGMQLGGGVVILINNISVAVPHLV